MAEGTFATAINCMDGRTQEPVINWMKQQYGVDYVDQINEAGPNKALLEGDKTMIDSIKKKLTISNDGHGSKALAIIGHHDCAGNPIDKREKVEQIKQSVALVRSWGYDMDIVGLYVNDQWQVEHVTS
ncbi:carbonic anhydrase [Alkalibacillus sp. S2W]|uniref:Carbonic anhydrase n=1 Tax=Alkalibacillus salilacus TaxID=284582 RepID=A0ABT9VH12_9BACI|nr:MULTISPECIES: carbonic anhydrase [Alkalibacillus]MDQ0160246.1 hypothetical protein [Alkalibacillus salilacus]NIK13204.1 hypothetical protein [Alkalibacillus almallahensis]